MDKEFPCNDRSDCLSPQDQKKKKKSLNAYFTGPASLNIARAKWFDNAKVTLHTDKILQEAARYSLQKTNQRLKNFLGKNPFHCT